MVVVVDNTRGDHPALAQAKQQLAEQYPLAAPYFRWTTNTQPKVETGLDKGSANVPGARVRQQTRDVALALDLALGAVDPAEVPAITLIMEDDFRLCPLGMLGISQAVRKANTQDPNWIAIRLSYGLNGVLMHTRDINEFSQYLESRVKARPPDHILVEWYCAEQAAAKRYVGDRPHFTFRYNLFDHLGKQSSLRDTPQGLFGGCYDVMDQGNVFEVEAFKINECRHDDIWPCLPASHANAEPPLLLDQLVKQGQVQARHNGPNK